MKRRKLVGVDSISVIAVLLLRAYPPVRKLGVSCWCARCECGLHEALPRVCVRGGVLAALQALRLGLRAL